MLPDWIKTDVYNAVIELQKNMISREQDGIIVISKGQAYFQNNDENFEVLLRKEKNKSRIILENTYRDNLFCFEINLYPDVKDPFDETDDIANKISKVV